VEVGRGAQGPERRGDLATMLQSARVVITWPSSGGGEFDDYRVVPTLHPVVIDNRPALLIRDSALLRGLFELNHPETADCRFRSSTGEPEIMEWDSVRYVGHRAPPT
jgi:hypothetical protein